MEKCFGCLSILFGSKHRTRRLKYLVNYRDGEDKHLGVEFENLMLDHEDRPNYGTDTQLVSQEEREYVTKRQYDKIIEEQRKVDEQIDKQMFEEEELIRVEEEAYYEAQREAARAASMTLSLKEKSSNLATNVGTSGRHNSLTLDEVEDDFEDFLEEVRSRSVAFRSQYAGKLTGSPSQEPPLSFDRGGDGQSSDDDYTMKETSMTSNHKQTDPAEWDNYISGLPDTLRDGPDSKAPLEKRPDPDGLGSKSKTTSRHTKTLDKRQAAERMFSITDDEDMGDFVRA